MVCDDNDVSAVFRETTQSPEIVKTGGEVQSGRGFIENQRLWTVNKCASQQAAALLPGRHGFQGRIPQRLDTEFLHGFDRSLHLFLVDKTRQGAVHADARIES